jgi:hypothetical protein
MSPAARAALLAAIADARAVLDAYAADAAAHRLACDLAEAEYLANDPDAEPLDHEADPVEGAGFDRDEIRDEVLIVGDRLNKVFDTFVRAITARADTLHKEAYLAAAAAARAAEDAYDAACAVEPGLRPMKVL